MVKQTVFVVHCERIGRRNAYYVSFPFNNELIQKIKDLPEETRSWKPSVMAWEVSTYSLYLLIKKFKGVDNIHFEFGSEDSRKIFIEQIKKIQTEDAEKRKFIQELNIKKEHWVQYKQELENDYIKYSDKLHSLLKEGVKLYPHQIVAAMFMNATRNTLISHEMGLGKTLSSILYAEMNGFEKVFVITPNSLKFNYYYEVQRFTDSLVHIVNWKKNNCTIEDAKYIIVNYDFFNPDVKSGRFQNKWKKLGIDKIDCLILDECLTYNTKILTDRGEIPIGEIVENKMNLNILSYNHELKKTELKPIKRYLYRGRRNVVTIILSDDTIIRCTSDHKFYSFERDMYIPIKDLKRGEKIFKWKNIENNNIEIGSIEIIELKEIINGQELWGCHKNCEEVYDLEIFDNHNFFANGVLVHNCQKIKTNTSNIYKNFKKTFNKKIFNGEKESKIFLSGTPAPNRAHELYTVLNQISIVDFPTKKYFYEYYCGMTRSEMGWGYVRDEMETKFEELFHKIAPFTHRKRKIDALKDLPDKTTQRIILEMSSQEEKTYNEIENSVANDFVLHPTGNPLTIMIRLRQYLGTLKINNVIELVNGILETGEKVVIVDYYKETLYELHKKLGNISALHTGDQTIEERSDIVKKFQDPDSDLKVFLASIQTANYGLTLTAASKLFIITLPYSVGEYDQVSDRCILKGELVLSKNGYIPIESINIGDLIYTVKGNWKRVVDVGSKIERRKVFYDIKYKGFYKPLRCTEDHKIYVYDYDKSNYCWIEASDIQLTKHGMVFPKINLNNYDHRFRMDEYVSNKYNKQNINLLPILSNELLYAFGRFVGDGHINNHQVSICGHIKEYLEVLKCIETIKNSFNIKNHTEYKRDNKIEIYISSIELRNNFRKWFGEGAYNKQIPDFIFHLNNNQIKSFLRGYYDADGYERKNTQQASTVSKYLVYQLVLLEGLLNNCPTVRFNDSAKCWSIEYSIKDKIKRNGLIRNIDGNIIYPIQEVRIYKPKRNDERVYDLTIEDDESFIVGLSSVHNCHRIGQKDAVNIYPLIFPNTIDDYVYSSIESKRMEIMKVMDNENYKSQINESVLSDVINKIKEKHGK